jgi:energy-coupling factor transport system permease protein
MGRTRGDPRAWLAWALAGGALAAGSRNPLVLGLLLLVALAVGLRLAPPSTIARSWRRAGWLIVWLAVVSALANLLTVRAGDFALVTLPSDWPLIGGSLTLNAIVYGLVTALAALALLAIWAVFNAVVGQGDLLRLTPRPLYVAGAIASVALTFLPGMALAARQIGEAQAVRGHRPRGPRDLIPLAAPLLSLGLERGLTLAEAMEARGFGHVGASEPSRAAAAGRRIVGRPDGQWLLATGLALGGAGLLLLVASPWPALGAIGVGLGAAAVALGLRLVGPGRSRYHRRRWTWGDTAVTLAAAAAVALLVAARQGDGGLGFTVYPSMQPPAVSIWGIGAALLLLTPALCAEAGWR